MRVPFVEFQLLVIDMVTDSNGPANFLVPADRRPTTNGFQPSAADYPMPSTVAPKGNNDSFAILNNCMPKGMPTTVTQKIAPTTA